MGELLPDKGPGWMGIRHHEQEADPPSKLSEVTLLMHGGSLKRLLAYCVNIMMHVF